MAALAALEAHEAVRQHPALDEGRELALDVRRQVPAFRFAVAQAREKVFLDHAVQQGCRRIPGSIDTERRQPGRRTGVARKSVRNHPERRRKKQTRLAVALEAAHRSGTSSIQTQGREFGLLGGLRRDQATS